MTKSIYAEDPKIVLESSDTVFIKQFIELSEILTQYETPNRYNVYSKNSKEHNYTMLFTAKEMSSYYERFLCSGETRPFEINLVHIKDKKSFNTDYKSNLFAVFKKGYTISSCCCCCRPKLEGMYDHNQGLYFGGVSFPFDMYSPVYQINDKNGKVVYSISTSCYQRGVFYGNCCDCFEPVRFLIFKGDNYDTNNIDIAVGSIIKYGMGFKTLISDQDNLEIVFPKESTLEEKMSLIGAALLIDCMLFEEYANDMKGWNWFKYKL